MRWYHITIAVLGGLMIALSFRLFTERSDCLNEMDYLVTRVATLEAELKQRRTDMQRNKGGSTELPDEPPAVQLTVVPPPPEPTAPAEPTPSAVEWPPTAAPETKTEPYPGAVTWKSREGVADVQKHLALSGAQTARLSKKLEEYFTEHGGSISGPEFLAARNQYVEEIAGTEAANQLKRRELEELQQEFDERIANETIVLARKVQLSPAQEERARQAIASAEQRLAPERQKVNARMREMMSLHFAGPEGQGELQKGYDEIRQSNAKIKKERDEALFGALATDLSDEQRNALLEYQSTRKE